MVRLSVNVDHVATLRQARRATFPDPVDAARIAEDTGAQGITVHLRSDRRHIQDVDVAQLRTTVRGKLNLEMAVTKEMIEVAVEIRPDQVSLVPERPEEVTTEGGLDLVARSGEVGAASRKLTAAGIAVSAFVDPEPRQISRLAELKPAGVAGFEINTDRYTRTGGDPSELKRIVECAKLGESAGLEVYAGHGLTTANVGPIATISQIEELNIGHSIISRAVLVGMAAAVKEMLTAMKVAPRS